MRQSPANCRPPCVYECSCLQEVVALTRSSRSSSRGWNLLARSTLGSNSSTSWKGFWSAASSALSRARCRCVALTTDGKTAAWVPPQKQREKTFDALLGQVEAISQTTTESD